MTSLNERVALVTRADRGIGAATAHRLATDGADVDLDADAAANTATEIAGKTGRSVHDGAPTSPIAIR